MTAPAAAVDTTATDTPVAPNVDYTWKEEDITVTKIKDKGDKAVEDVKFRIRYKVYKGFDNLVAAFGGQSVAENVLAAAHDNRTKGKASTTLRQKIKKGSTVEEATKAAQAVAESFVYSERGVSAKKVGEAAQEIQKEITNQGLDPEKMDEATMREYMRRFLSL